MISRLFPQPVELVPFPIARVSKLLPLFTLALRLIIIDELAVMGY